MSNTGELMMKGVLNDVTRPSGCTETITALKPGDRVTWTRVRQSAGGSIRLTTLEGRIESIDDVGVAVVIRRGRLQIHISKLRLKGQCTELTDFAHDLVKNVARKRGEE